MKRLYIVVLFLCIVLLSVGCTASPQDWKQGGLEPTPTISYYVWEGTAGTNVGQFIQAIPLCDDGIVCYKYRTLTYDSGGMSCVSFNSLSIKAIARYC